MLGKNARTYELGRAYPVPDQPSISAAIYAASQIRRVLGRRLASRDIIGQAKGILMNPFKIDADRAFGMLRSLSQSSNEPVRIIAEQTVDTF